jgi:hypothetical protein
MVEKRKAGPQKNWRDLCTAILEAKDPEEMLKVVDELNLVFEAEDRSGRDNRRKKTNPKHTPREAHQ